MLHFHMGIFEYKEWEYIYELPMKCYKCGKEILVYYPEDVANYHFDIPTLKENIYSRTQGRNTVGNICPHCGTYIGNWHVQNRYIELASTEGEEKNLIFYPEGILDNNPDCAKCGISIDYDIPFRFISEVDIEEEPPDYYCSQCTLENKIDKFADIFENNQQCSICKKICVSQEYLDELKEMLIMDFEIFTAKEIVPHHTNYESDTTIPVCTSCHAKIELSTIPEYKKYRSVDKRPDKRKFKLVPCGNNCGKRAKVKISDFKEDKKYYCSKCKSDNKDDKLSLEDWLEKIARE